MEIIIGFCRYALPILTFIILFKCFQALLIGHPVNKTYGYIIDRRTGEKIALNTWETSIGRSKSCDIVLPYNDVSRFHAVICRRVDGWYLFDTVSKLGTFVNGEKIDNSITIKHTDEISFGENPFVFAVTNDPVIQVGKRKKNKKTVVNQNKPIEESIEKPIDFVPYNTETTDNFDISGFNLPDEDLFIDFHPKSKPDNNTFNGKDIFSDNVSSEVFGTNFDTASNEINTSFAQTSKNPSTAQAAVYIPSLAETYLLCSNQIVLGRSRTSDIKIDARDISRNHAVLSKIGNDWYISDTNSTYGTFVNGQKVLKATKLHNNDLIKLSDTEIKFIADYK